MKYIIIILLLGFGLSANSQITSTAKARAFADKWVRNNPIDAFTNLRMNQLIKALANLIDSVEADIVGGPRVVDSLYKTNDSTIQMRIKRGGVGYLYNIPLYNPSGPFFTGVITDGTLTGNGMSTSPLKVDSTQWVTWYRALQIARGAYSAGTNINIDVNGVISATPGASVVSGTYVPLVTITSNTNACLAGTWQYMRVGNIVTVYGYVIWAPAASGSAICDFTLPFASDFTDTNDAIGTALYVSPTLAEFGAVQANVSSDKARVTIITAYTPIHPVLINFSYNIL